MIIGTGKSIDIARSRTNEMIERVLKRINNLGLEVSGEKTEAVLFYGAVRPSVDLLIRVGRHSYVSQYEIPWYNVRFAIVIPLSLDMLN